MGTTIGRVCIISLPAWWWRKERRTKVSFGITTYDASIGAAAVGKKAHLRTK